MTHHRRGLRRHLRDDELLASIEESWRDAPIAANKKSMLAYAEKLTLRPAKVTKADVDDLRRTGFSDQDILAIAEVTAYYAYVNRIADGLGVMLEA